MGFSLYICENCHQINMESDLGDHKPCERDESLTQPQRDAVIDRTNEKLEELWGGASIKEISLAYFDTFVRNVDRAMGLDDCEERQECVKIVNSFMYGSAHRLHGGPTYRIDEITRTEADKIKTPLQLRRVMNNINK